MASSIKVLLWNKANKEGLFPIAVRIIKNRKPTYFYIGHYIEKSQWDIENRRVKKSHPNSVRLNSLIAKKLAEANETLIELQSNDNDVSSKQIKQEINQSLTKGSFNDVAQEYLYELESRDKLSQLGSDRTRIEYVIEFAKSGSITFREIDESFLKKFMTFLKIKKGNSQRSIVNNLVVIRTLYNIAIRKGIVDRKHYPFGKDKIRIKFPETEKVGLSSEEVKAIEGLENLSRSETHARNVWLFSFYLAGMRIGDVLTIKWNDIYDGRLHYRMNKNDKLLSLKLPERIYPVLEYYKNDQQSHKDYIFPEMKKANRSSPKDILRKTKTATKKFNKHLHSIATKAEIDKKLTMHIARHTFGNISGDKIPIQVLQKLYRHSSILTTINYQSNFTHSEEDKALNSVLDY